MVVTCQSNVRYMTMLKSSIVGASCTEHGGRESWLKVLVPRLGESKAYVAWNPTAAEPSSTKGPCISVTLSHTR